MAEKCGLSERCVTRAAPLFSLLRPDEIAAARLIKIDVEGAEREVVAGFGSILEAGRRDLEVVVEVSAEAFDQVVSFFRKHGFFSYRIENTYQVAEYICRQERKKPMRFDALPRGETQVELIFSRTNSASLA